MGLAGCSLICQCVFPEFPAFDVRGCLCSLRTLRFMMGLAGCGSAMLKPQSYRWSWLLLQNRRRVSRPPSGIVPDGNFDLGILVVAS